MIKLNKLHEELPDQLKKKINPLFSCADILAAYGDKLGMLIFLKIFKPIGENDEFIKLYQLAGKNDQKGISDYFENKIKSYNQSPSVTHSESGYWPRMFAGNSRAPSSVNDTAGALSNETDGEQSMAIISFLHSSLVQPPGIEREPYNGNIMYGNALTLR